jgi:hypothetical protein
MSAFKEGVVVVDGEQSPQQGLSCKKSEKKEEWYTERIFRMKSLRREQCDIMPENRRITICCVGLH